MRHIRVLVAEAHPLVATILKEIVEQDPAVSAIGVAADLVGASALVGELHPDIVLVGHSVHGASALDTVRALKRLHGDVPIVVLGEDDDDYASEAHRAGASAYVDRSQLPGGLSSVLRRVASLNPGGLAPDRAADMAVLEEIGRSLSAVRPQESMERALAVLRRAAGAEAGEVFLVEPERHGMALAAFDGLARSAFFQITRFEERQGYPGLVLARHEPLVVDRLEDDPRYLRTAVKQKGFHAYVCMPLMGPEGLLGSLHIASQRREFDTQRALHLLSLTGPLIGVTLGTGLELQRLRDDPPGTSPAPRRQPAPPDPDRRPGGPSRGSGTPLPSDGLVQQSSDAAFLLDGEGRIVDWNDVAESLLGYRRDEVLGEPCWRVVRAETATGEPFCSPACAASTCFLRRVPFKSSPLRVRDRTGRAIPATIGTVSLPREETGDPMAPAVLVFVRAQDGAMNAPAAATLRLYCLGPLQVYLDEKPVDWRGWTRKQAVTLLAFLAHHRGQPVHRELIIDALWPQSHFDEGLERLKVTVYALRQELGRAAQFIVRQGPSYTLDATRLWLDAGAFEGFLDDGLRRARRGQGEAALGALEAAQALYRGPYFQAERYAEWALPERARLAERYLDLLHAMGSLLEGRSRWREATGVYRLALIEDPTREEMHRLLARALIAQGDQAAAALQLRRCAEVLRRELGVGLSAETLALQRALEEGTAPRS